MITQQQVANIVGRYDLKNITIGTLGSHSALEVMDGAKDEDIKSVCICQRGREIPYQRFKRLSSEIILLDKFSDIMNPENQDQLRRLNTIIVPHRAFTAYLGYHNIENNLEVPIFGNRHILRAEERRTEKNQYYLLDRARIRRPKVYSAPTEIDHLAIVKIQEARRNLERAFFLVSSYEDYMEKANLRIKRGLIKEEDLNDATIEEYIIGTYFNFNYFHSPIEGETEFLGIERRLQTNLHDFTTSLPARDQLEIDFDLQNIEVGHMPASIRESLLEKVFKMGDDFTAAVKKEYPPGLIGPISLQSIVTVELDLVVYDISLRVPGNPIMTTTSPYTKYSYGHPIGVGRRVAMEVKNAIKQRRLVDIVS